ncbi:MAG TPA: PhnD/SsuA/transferrin family substrate-binding protein, partial [Pseudobdellovibrionaceae bacterium]|nr:PhnD/SsuA/transferrin family substrate-binding protein [Pseudobdellovibrionaceae bacterium]
LKDIKNKKIIFVDEYSTSGYLYPLVMLKKAGIQKNDLEILFSKNHEASIQMLAEKKAEVAAVFADDEKGLRGAWTKFPVKDLNLRVLKVSDPIPNDPFCVRTDFFEKYPQISYQLMSELIDMNQEENLQKKYSNILGAGSLNPATSKQYDPVREMIEELEK